MSQGFWASLPFQAGLASGLRLTFAMANCRASLSSNLLMRSAADAPVTIDPFFAECARSKCSRVLRARFREIYCKYRFPHWSALYYQPRSYRGKEQPKSAEEVARFPPRDSHLSWRMFALLGLVFVLPACLLPAPTISGSNVAKLRSPFER